MNRENDLTLYGWFAGEESRMMIDRNHEQYRWSRDIAHSDLKRKLLDSNDGKKYVIGLMDWTYVDHHRIFGNPGWAEEKWDGECIQCYVKQFKDGSAYIKSFGKHYEQECDIECHRCGVELTPLTRTIPGETICDRCDDAMTHTDFPL